MSDNEWPRPAPPPGDGEWGEPPHAPHRIVISTVLVLVVLLVAGGVTWQLMRNGSSQPAAQASAPPSPAATQPSVTPCPDPELTVVVAPEIEPVVKEAADTLNPDGQRCAPITVRAEEPGVTAAAAARADVWVPSSSAWLPIAAENGAAYTVSGKPVAYSPVLLAGPEAVGSLYIEDGKSAWTSLIQGIAGGRIPSVTMPDPLRSTVGLLSVHGVNTATARTTPDAGIAQLRALTLRSRVNVAGADQASLLNRMAGQPDSSTAVYEIGIFPVTEQQFRAYEKANHPVRLVAAPPVDGRVEADYPYAISKSAKKDLAESLRAAIGKSAVTAAGFRTEPTAGAMRLPGRAAQLLAPARQWSQYQKLEDQVLLLIDSSGSMNEKITDRGGRSTTKAELLRQSGATAAELFDDDTNIGMWFFGSAGRGGPAHTEQVSFGPINSDAGGKPRRAALVDAIKAYKPQAGAGTPLYQAVLDGVSAMREQAKPGTVTTVVVLTDGADGGSRFAMSQPEFLKRLAAGQDPQRPVPIFAVGYGPAANTAALQGMAKATGGKAIEARNPADLAGAMAQAFLAAHTRS
ncbi:substrate-binding domain-containing protein [Actinoplanes sp. GCM10030250]|uniref:substrate-binding domain-containing protein n=1 Tax=Actinoplanes sp. GCM10030250 TaxID=3273376 RepID=UPI00360AE271